VSFKLALDVGYSNPQTRAIVQPVDEPLVRQMILQAGGRLTDDENTEVVRRSKIAAFFAARGRPVLGYLGGEYVVRHESGFLMIAVGNGSNPQLLGFLQMAVADGCTIWTEDGPATESVLDELTASEQRYARARRKH
jgi:hypothetical protein